MATWQFVVKDCEFSVDRPYVCCLLIASVVVVAAVGTALGLVCFEFSSLLFLLFLVRQIKLATRQLLGARYS